MEFGWRSRMAFVAGSGRVASVTRSDRAVCGRTARRVVTPARPARGLCRMSSAEDAAAGQPPADVDMSQVSGPVGSEAAPAEARGSGGVDSMADRLKVSAFIALWYIFNIVYNISNKQVLNVYPYPWFVAWIQLVFGVVYALTVWALGLRKRPKFTKELIRNYLPVAIFHDIGHVATVVSLGAVAVSFTHVVKAMEPFVNVVASAIILKSVFPIPVYLSLMPVVGGVIMASVNEVSFTMMGFLSAMTSNFAFVGRNIYSKLGLNTSSDKNMSGANLFAVISIIAAVILAPFPFIFEGTSMISGWTAVTSGANAVISSGRLFRTLAISGIFFHMYQEVAFLALDSVHPVTHSVANTVKRVVIIITSIIVFQNPVTKGNAIGSTIAIVGVLLYSLTKNYYAQKEKKEIAAKAE